MDVITTHTNADFDTIASIVAAKKIYPHAVVVFPGSMEKTVRNFFKDQPLPDLTPTKLNKIDFEKVDRLILIDTRQAGRIGRFANLIGRPGIDIHIYDHHPPTGDDIRGSLEVTEPVGSTTTIMVKLLQEKKISLTPEEATVMMLGIYEDTGFLTFISTTIEDYHAAAYLLSKGADLKAVAHIIRQEMTADEVELLNNLNKGATVHRIKGMDIVVTKASSEKYIADAAAMVHKMMEMSGNDALFALLRMEAKIFLVARSKIKEVDAGRISAQMGGGGHPTAASAVIKEMTLIEVEQKLIEVLGKNVRGIRKAAHIMSSPVKTIPSSKTAAFAKEVMAKYNINVLPVIDGDRLTGIISRQDLGKAIFHGLDKHPVSELMTTDFATVDEEGSLSRVEEIIIENNQKFLPVVKDEALTGCITRTDVLRALHYDRWEEKDLSAPGTFKKDVSGLIEGKLPKWLLGLLQVVGEEADKKGLGVHLVGGFVRDLLLGRENLDIDIVVEGDGIAFASNLAKQLNGRVRSHQKFGTAVIILPDGFKVDIATARMEFYKKPAALPTVEAGPLKMDLYRRDFTINSLAVKLNHTNFGELTDHFGGVKDIKEKAIRVLHNLSFIEDPTRAFRAVRLEQRLGFHIGPHSLSLIKNASRLDFFDKLSPSRIFNELKIILMEENPLPALKRMEKLDILRFFHPKFKIGSNFEKPFHELQKVMDWYDLLFKKEQYTRWVLFLALLQTELKLKEVEEMSKAIGMAARFRGELVEIKKARKELPGRLRKNNLDNISLYHLLSPLSIETLLFIMSVSGNSGTKENVSRFIRELKETKIETTGKDLEKLNLPPGPLYKTIQEALLDERLSGRVKNKEGEISYIRKTWLEK